MAAALAASLPAPVLPQADAQPQVTKVPQRLEGVVDPEALRDVESVSLNALVRVSSCRTIVYMRSMIGIGIRECPRKLPLTFRSSSR